MLFCLLFVRNQQFFCFFPSTDVQEPGTPVLEDRCDFQWKWPHLYLKMDFQHRAGGKTGSGGVASASESNRDRRERLRQLALETIDINKDPYFMKNHLGSYECKLCLTLHNNEVSRSVIRHKMKWSEVENALNFNMFHWTAQLCIDRAVIWLTHKERNIRPICESNANSSFLLSLFFDYVSAQELVFFFSFYL